MSERVSRSVFPIYFVFLCPFLLLPCLGGQEGATNPPIVAVLPQVVAGELVATGQTFYSEVTVLNSSAFECEIVIEEIGRDDPEAPGFVLFGGDPLPLLTAVPPKSVLRQQLDVPTDAGILIEGAIAVRNATPGCEGALSADARYLVRLGDKLIELFATGQSLGLLPGGCFLAPADVGLNLDEESFSQPGFAVTAPAPTTGRICIDGQEGGDIILGPRCTDYDGSHTTRLFSDLFPETQGYQGGIRVCYSSEEENPPPIFPLILQVATLGEDLQFGAIPGQVTGENCCPDENRACLFDGRLSVELDVRNSPSGLFAPALFEGSEGTYYGRFRSGEGTSEAQHAVQLIDGCSVIGGFWVFWGATTAVDYELRVTDVESGATETFTGSGQTTGLHVFGDPNEFKLCRLQ